MKVRLLDFHEDSGWGNIPLDFVGEVHEVIAITDREYDYRVSDDNWYFKKEWVEVVEKEESKMELDIRKGNIVQFGDSNLVGIVERVDGNEVVVYVGLERMYINKNSIKEILADELPLVMDYKGELAAPEVLSVTNDKMARLLREYDYKYTEAALKTIVDDWNASKGILRAIFRKHPKWNEDLQMIVLEKENFKNTINWKDVNKFCKFWKDMTDRYARTHQKKVGAFTISELLIMKEKLENIYNILNSCEVHNIYARYLQMDKNEVDIEIFKLRKLLSTPHYSYCTSAETVYVDKETKDIINIFEACREFFVYIYNGRGSHNNETLIDDDSRFTKEGVHLFEKIINNYGYTKDEVKCSFVPQVGQAVTKWVGKCFKNLELDKFVNMKMKRWTTDNGEERERPYDDGWNGHRAMLGDAFNTSTYTDDVYVSINLIDYLTMSFLNGATSCQSIDKRDLRNCHRGDYQGCYSSATLSYAGDEVSLVMYSINRDAKNVNKIGEEADPDCPPYRATKQRRMLAFVGEDKLICSRLYPDGRDGGDETIADQWRNILQKVIADCLDTANMWTLKRGTTETSRVIDKGDYATCYPDWENCEDVNVSYLRNIDGVLNYKGITVGHEPICIYCGSHHSREDKIICEDCDEEGRCVCEYCDNSFDPDDGIETADGNWYCCGGCANNANYYQAWDDNRWYHQDELVYDEYTDRDYSPNVEYEYDAYDDMRFVLYEHDWVCTEDDNYYVSSENAEADGYVCNEDGEWVKEEEMEVA